MTATLFVKNFVTGEELEIQIQHENVNSKSWVFYEKFGFSDLFELINLIKMMP